MKRMMVLIMLMVGVLAFGGAPSIYPGVNEIHLKNGRGQGNYIIFNKENTNKKYKITINNDESNELDLGNYLRVFPKYIEIEPKENKTIRLLIRDFPQKKDGEYKATISIEEVTSNLNEKYKSKKEIKGFSANIAYKYIINTAIYGYVGNVFSEIEVDITKNTSKQLTGTVKNKGNYSYPLSAKFLDKDSKVILEGGLEKLMKGEKQPLNLKVPELAKKLEIYNNKTEELLYQINIKK